ncbi:MFS transporter [Amorphus orientalis]|uniref:MFS family permease n=1 Tax=Amorphus orientalis TaxID=649198 RepID=A0AAE3VPM8_9HYPH|nr:MFS transporter [Amorphus orientalis]MDQ0315923.1 MFS family permease [Amorphus orientalis]
MPLFPRVFIPFSAGYLVSYLIRVINAVAGEPIAAEFDLLPGELGFLTSVYFLSFACAQLPNGILMDRFGPRRVQAALLLVGCLGTLAFARAESFAGLGVSRFVMGLGLAACLTAPLTAYRLWFGVERLSMVTGLHMAVGGLGAFLGGAPTDALIRLLGWRGVFDVVAVVLLITAALTFFFVPKRDYPSSPLPVSTLIRELSRILIAKPFWRLCPLSVSVQGIALSVGSLWAGPWLRDAAGVSSQVAAIWMSAIAVALVVGFLLFGWLGQRAAARGLSSERVFLAGSLGFLIVQILMAVLPPQTAAPLWLAYAVFGSVGVTSFVVAARSFPSAMAGRVNTALNFFIFVMAFLIQWLFGEFLDLFPASDGGATAAGYRWMFAILALFQAVTFVPFLLWRRPEA